MKLFTEQEQGTWDRNRFSEETKPVVGCVHFEVYLLQLSRDTIWTLNMPHSS